MKTFENFNNRPELNLAPFIDATNLSSEATSELDESEVSTHYAYGVVNIWSWESNEFPLFKKWLIETYGEEIKRYKRFGIIPT